MKHLFNLSRSAVAVVLALMVAVPAHAFDDLGAPPPEPADAVLRPVTADTIQEELDRRLIDRFTKAAGTSPYLTAEQARASGWGFVADHFAQIDRRRQGYVRIKDIQAFMDARAPGDPEAARERVRAAKAAAAARARP
jgi:hypothetical protein